MASLIRVPGRVVAVAWVHLLVSALVAGFAVFFWVMATLLEPTFHGTFVPDMFATLGQPILIAFVSLAIAQAVAAVGLLRGREWARIMLSGFGVLLFPIVPFGTAVSAYTFWVLLILWRHQGQ